MDERVRKREAIKLRSYERTHCKLFEHTKALV